MPKGKPPRLPMELRAVESMLARKDGRLWFRLHWDVLVHEGNVNGYPKTSYYDIRGKLTTWSCSSVDEMLWAITRAIQDLEHSPGVERESPAVGMPEASRCPNCGRNVGSAIDHRCPRLKEGASDGTSNV